MQDLFHIEMPLTEVNAISMLGLAHMGDCVFELLVRSMLCSQGSCTAKELHCKTVQLVSAPAQSQLMEHMLPLLTEEELSVFRRGRNTHVHAVPKNATGGEYSRATGLECLFGYLYLLGRQERINELFCRAMEAQHAV